MSRVAVAMSGGVDSSVAALLLTQAGHEVTGVTMRLVPLACTGEFPETACCSREAHHRAETICQQLDIPHYALDFTRQFEEGVIRDFCEAYAEGRTPNPCLRCNERLKFGALLEMMRGTGIEFVATGHYATCEPRDGRMSLRRGVDPSKDQSYALYGLTQEQLAHALFPLGALTKSRVRDIAREHDLLTADTPDSQDLCFVPEGTYRDFLGERLAPRPGPICDPEGKQLGEHGGLHTLTVGQRSGLGISAPHPLYVVALDVESNTATVGPKDAVPRQWCVLTDLNWVSNAGRAVGESVVGEAEVRYRSEPTPATLTVLSDTTARVNMPENANALTRGQSVVLYQGDAVVAGGIIDEAGN